nr:palindromic element RPE4 domain-containing protein [Rickettsia felis]
MQTEHYRVLYYSVSSRGLSTGSSNKKYKKLDLSRFMLDPVDKPRDDNTFLITPSIFNSPEIFFFSS